MSSISIQKTLLPFLLASCESAEGIIYPNIPLQTSFDDKEPTVQVLASFMHEKAAAVSCLGAVVAANRLDFPSSTPCPPSPSPSLSLLPPSWPQSLLHPPFPCLLPFSSLLRLYATHSLQCWVMRRESLTKLIQQ